MRARRLTDELNIHRLDSADASFSGQLGELLNRSAGVAEGVHGVVVEIIARIRDEGDGALLELTRRLDSVDVASAADLKVAPSELERAWSAIDSTLRHALEKAAHRIKLYHQRQLQESWDYVEEDGTRLGQKVSALDRVGLYVPGGKAAYPSSVLMNAIPAKIAGVPELIMTVPTPHDEVNQLVLAAAALVGVDQVYRVGGAQAIAAMAYGTATIPRVDKIVGPGNAFVAAAKQMVFGQVGIDMIAGPSEVVVICDETAKAEWVAMDLLAQAEHDERAQAIAISSDAAVLERVSDALETLLPTLERASIAQAALAAQGALILVKDLREAVDVVNRIAPEHLELLIEDASALVESVRHAGAIFVGHHSAESLGDYCVGPNHVLPTSGTARFSSPLGVYDFQKRTSVIQCSQRGARDLGATAATLARAESLTAHARAAEYRTRP